MQQSVNTYESELTVSYGGPSDIDVVTLSGSLGGLSDILSAITTKYPDAYCKIKVTQQSEGSFVIDLSSVVVQTATLLASEANLSLEIINNLLSIFNNLSFLKGEKPRNITKTKSKYVIENFEGKKLEISDLEYSFMTNAKINNSTVLFANSIVIDNDRTFTKFSSKSNDLLIQKDQLGVVGKSANAMLEYENKIQVSKMVANVRVIKAVFEGDAKWSVFYNNRFDLKIEDEDWLKRFQDGKVSLGPGSWLKADIRVESIFDNSYQPTGEIKYFAEKILDVIPAEEQDSLFE